MCSPSKYDWVAGPKNPNSISSDDQDYLSDKGKWLKFFEENFLQYDDKLDEVLLEDHTLASLRFDGSGEPPLKHPFTSVWFPGEMCLKFQFFHVVGRESKLNKR